MRTELLESDSPRWTEVLAGVRHDFYHLPEYLEFAVRRQEPGQPLAFVAEDEGHRLFVPLIVRSIPDAATPDGTPRFDVSGPRGYPGPLVVLDPTHEPDDFVDQAVGALTTALRERGVVSAFIRLHPLLTPALEPFRRAGTIVHHGESTSIDLTMPEEELWRQMDHGHRQGIRKATKLGYAARVDDSWERFDDFVAVYQESMRRLHAQSFWHFSTDYFRDLRGTLGERLHLCVVEIGDELAAAGLLTEVGGMVEFHLSGTADAHLRASPSKVLIHHARTWAKGRGDRCFHLTGSLWAGDPLSQFKAGFSPTRHPVSTWRLIVDPEAYRRLSSEWEAVHGVEADAPDGYFPAYRSPGPRP